MIKVRKNCAFLLDPIARRSQTGDLHVYCTVSNVALQPTQTQHPVVISRAISSVRFVRVLDALAFVLLGLPLAVLSRLSWRTTWIRALHWENRNVHLNYGHVRLFNNKTALNCFAKLLIWLLLHFWKVGPDPFVPRNRLPFSFLSPVIFSATV